MKSPTIEETEWLNSLRRALSKSRQSFKTKILKRYFLADEHRSPRKDTSATNEPETHPIPINIEENTESRIVESVGYSICSQNFNRSVEGITETSTPKRTNQDLRPLSYTDPEKVRNRKCHVYGYDKEISSFILIESSNDEPHYRQDQTEPEAPECPDNNDEELKKFIHNQHQSQELKSINDIISDFQGINCEKQHTGCVLSPKEKAVTEKFVVNLYESRKPKRSEFGGSVDRMKAGVSMGNLTTKWKLERSLSLRERKSALVLFPRDTTDDPKEDHIFSQLRKESDFQCEIMRQASNALNLCRQNYSTSPDVEIAAERILLAAGFKHKKILEQIRYGKYHEELKNPATSLATVEISNLKFEVNPDLDNGGSVETFVCIVSLGAEIFYTNVLVDVDGIVSFPEKFHFKDVSPDFKLDVSIFSVHYEEMRQSYFGNRSIFRSKKYTKPICRKLWHKGLQTYEMLESDILKTSFTLRGTYAVTIKDMNTNRKHLLRFTPAGHTTLTENASCKVSAKDVKIHTRRSGFLTFGVQRKDYILWDKRWCVLDGYFLDVFRSPDDEDELESRIARVDLRTCTSSNIQDADQNTCARPKTILMETIDFVVHQSGSLVSEFKIHRHYLHGDTWKEIQKWHLALNDVLVVLKEWKLRHHCIGEEV